jgi:uncharacterized paraquat-inducible protein A
MINYNIMDKEELKKILIENAKNIKPYKMPTVTQMAKNIVETTVATVKTVANGNSPTVSEEDANKRKSICNGCEAFNKEQERCTKCGCHMAVKTYLRAATCPLGKW